MNSEWLRFVNSCFQCSALIRSMPFPTMITLTVSSGETPESSSAEKKLDE